MPTYQYNCPDCGLFETYQKVSEDTLTKCPTCESAIKKVFSVPGVVGMQNVPNTVSPTYRPDRSAVWNSAQAE